RGNSLGFEGEFLTETEVLELDLKAEKINPATVNHYLEQDLEITGSDLDFCGSFRYDGTEPQIQGEINTSRLVYGKHKLTDVSVSLKYRNNNIIVNDYAFLMQEARIDGDGSISFSPESEPYLKTKMAVREVPFAVLEDLFETSLPLRGSMTGSLSVEGGFSSLTLTGDLTGERTEIIHDDMNITPDSVDLKFTSSEEKISVERLAAKLDEGVVEASGEIEEGDLGLAYQVNSLSSEYLNLEEDFAAVIGSTGRIEGRIEAPRVEGEFDAGEVRYAGYNLKQMRGKFVYEEDRCVISEGRWDLGEGGINFSGEIGSLSTEPVLDFEISTAETELQPLLEMAGVKEIPADFDYFLSGSGRWQGSFTEAVFSGDFRARSESGGVINADGEIGREVEVDVEGNKVEIGGFLKKILPDYRMSGTTDFRGEISGEYPGLAYDFETQVNSVKINGYRAGSATGNLHYRSGEGLNIEQRLSMEDREILLLEGEVFFTPEPELALQFTADEIPLALMTNMLPTIEGSGYLKGGAEINGSFEKPELAGDMELNVEELNLIELEEEVSDVGGDIDFSGRTVVLSDFSGKYDGGEFNLEGSVDPFTPEEDFWDLEFSGTDLYFDYGSYRGRFDPEIEVVGPLFVPLIRGDLLVHDFTAFLPHFWPESEGEGLFTPELDLTLNTGSNIFLRSENINVPVQQGELNLTYLDEVFNIEGVLTSNQGSFDYYNNKFLVESAEAEFIRYEEGIPELDVEAWTTVGDTSIQIMLTGPSDNMETVFSSDPPLEEDEILELLVSKGGLGSVFVDDEDTTVLDIVTQEVLRFVQKTFQLNVVGNLEENFADIFELDRVDINAYQLGSSQEVDLYLGKNLSNKVYLEYVATFTPEIEDNEISFSYYLQDNVFLEGAWQGEDSYRLTIETTFDF
ncbi:MAG: translocation/assembly module TamB domain-containing protein, partial [Halanaerobiales bacterium]